jgi:multiple antibiotic resistance protein
MVDDILKNFLLFIVLLNPVSKILVLSVLIQNNSRYQLKYLALRSSLTALIILLIFAYAGTFLLREIFHIEIYSLQIAGGTILFLIGLHALQKGEFFAINTQQKLEDIAVVPIASPMIAGPATITASISQAALFGASAISLSIMGALIINFLIMIFAVEISEKLKRFNLMGPLIRITGLFVASIGVNMALTGVKSFLAG